MKCYSSVPAFHSPTGALFIYLLSTVTSRCVKGQVGSTQRKMIWLLRVEADDLTFVRIHQKRYFYSLCNNESRRLSSSRRSVWF